MEKSCKVSVIIPTYNRGKYVTEAIDSVLAQTYRGFEIIVVDDGSTDGTGAMLWEKYGDRVRYHFKENGGCASARNCGIKMARGEYITLLDSDDKYLPQKLEDQAAILDARPDIGFVYSDSYAFSEDLQRRSPSVRPDRHDSVAYPLFMMTYMANGSFLVRKTCLDETGHYDESLRYNEDTDLMLRLAVQCKAYYSHNPTFAYRLHSGRKSSNNIKLLEAVYVSSDSLLNKYPSFREKIGSQGTKRLGQIKLDLAMEYAMQKDFSHAVEELNVSYKIHPRLKKRLYTWLLSKEIVRHSPGYKLIAYFEQIILKALQWRVYRYTGWIM